MTEMDKMNDLGLALLKQFPHWMDSVYNLLFTLHAYLYPEDPVYEIPKNMNAFKHSKTHTRFKPGTAPHKCQDPLNNLFFELVVLLYIYPTISYSHAEIEEGGVTSLGHKNECDKSEQRQAATLILTKLCKLWADRATEDPINQSFPEDFEIHESKGFKLDSRRIYEKSQKYLDEILVQMHDTFESKSLEYPNVCLFFPF